MQGPNTAPNPAQAKDTIPKTELLGSQAITTPNTATAIRVALAVSMAAASDKLIPRVS